MLQWLIFIDKNNPTTSVSEPRTGHLEKKIKRNHNYPIPFNPTSAISFTLPVQTFVTLEVFDSSECEVPKLISNQMFPGIYSKQWFVRGLLCGTYFARLLTSQLIGKK
jgi:hypothetical protein